MRTLLFLAILFSFWPAAITEARHRQLSVQEACIRFVFPRLSTLFPGPAEGRLVICGADISWI